MPFSASIIEIALRYTWLGQKCQTARTYTWDGAAIAAATPAQLGEAWWNHYKDAWRDIGFAGLSTLSFDTVFVREVGGGLAYGEFAIPTGERAGTRGGSLGEPLPSYVACGCRLSVGTSVTRPGQMRIPFLCEVDTSSNVVQPGFLALADPLATLYSESNILGAPTATGVVTPVVVRYDGVTGLFVASQPVVGFVLNAAATSQVSRRVGHGT